MKKVVLIISLLISVNLFADLVSEQKAMHKEGMVALRGGDYKEAIKKFKELCEDGYGLGCLKLGSMYRDGKGFKKDIDKAIELYKKSCASNENTSGCYTLTKMLSKKEFNTYVTKLCDKNIGVGCFYLAEPEKGEKMAELYMKACDNGYPLGCYTLSKKRDIDKEKYPTKKVLMKGCAFGNKSACMRLGHILIRKKDYLKAVNYFNKACDLDGSAACSRLSYIYSDGKYGIDKNLTIAKIFCDKAESLGMVNICGSKLNKEILLLKEAKKGKK